MLGQSVQKDRVVKKGSLQRYFLYLCILVGVMLLSSKLILTVNNIHRRYSGQKAWCRRIQALYLYVIVFSLNCKISDILPKINGAQVGYTLKDINAGRNSSRDTAQKAEMKAKANSLINVLFPTLKGTLLFGSSISVHGD